MSTVVITPIYAAAFALMFIGLSVRTLRLRRRHQVAVGSGDKPVLQRAIRAHANFAEYVPLTLLLISFLEGTAGSTAVVHGVCAALLVGRCLHAVGISQVVEDYRWRVAGMALTFLALGLTAMGLLLGALQVRLP